MSVRNDLKSFGNRLVDILNPVDYDDHDEDNDDDDDTDDNDDDDGNGDMK